MPDWMTKEIGGKSGGSKSYSSGFSFSLTGELDDGERSLIKGVVGVVLIIIIYIALSNILFNEMNKKISEVSVESSRVTQQEASMNTDKTKLDDKTSEYTELIHSIEEKAQIDTESKRLKYSVPTLLNKIMYAIPTNVQLTSVANTGTKITITAQSDKYEGLGIFIAKLNNDGILTNVVSDTSKKTNDVVVVTIEGELP